MRELHTIDQEREQSRIQSIDESIFLYWKYKYEMAPIVRWSVSSCTYVSLAVSSPTNQRNRAIKGNQSITIEAKIDLEKHICFEPQKEAHLHIQKYHPRDHLDAHSSRSEASCSASQPARQHS